MYVTTGIEALDLRVGGFARGRYYILNGPPGSGKTTAALQFLEAGLRQGETCVVLTQDDPGDLLSQGNFLGFDLRAAEQAGRLVVLRYRLDFARNFSRVEDAAAVFRELEAAVADVSPTRLVIDTVLPLLDGGRAGDSTLSAFQAFLERRPETTLLIAPGNLGKDYYVTIYDRLVAGVGGILDFDFSEGDTREVGIRKLRHEASASGPFRFVIRPGAGIVEHVAPDLAGTLPPAVLQRVVLLDPGERLPRDLRDEVQTYYDLASYTSVEAAFAELASGRFGALVVTMDPLAPEPVLEFVSTLRSAGNGAPILIFSSQDGLRSATRARALRAGGDDILTDALSPQEVLQRIDSAREKGHRRNLTDSDARPPARQPHSEDGREVVPEAEFREAVATQTEAPHAVFAVVLLWPGAAGTDAAVQMFLTNLRTDDGDLISVLDTGQVALYVHDIRRAALDRLLQRLGEAHPGCVDVESASVFCFPRDREELRAWTGLVEASATRAVP